MNLPPPAHLMPVHRHDGQFWDTRMLIELLIVRFGASSLHYGRSREYRALIATIRMRNSANLYRKGYALDWKGLKWDEKRGKRTLVRDKEAYSIKSDLLEYLKRGRIPYTALPYACEHLREAQVRKWADTLVRQGENG